ncbi:MAG: sigma-54-dependent Fis family transcriptional regulator, partial [Deltaproteobacteria bacterium]|nr:sigma-54-dependent Fis family transcriptional regulator [Deltaproteobacteria bacterium]
SGTILVVDDDPDIREVLRDRLESLGCRVLLAPSGKEGLELLEKQSPQMVLLDIEMPGMNGLEVLKEIRRREIDVTVVMITAYGTVERAVQAMKQGAYDFIPKPFEPDHIALTVQKALEREKLRRGVEILSETVSQRYHLVAGKSAKMKDAIDTAQKAADSKATVLLLGESGTGKEIFARAIHTWGERKGEAFIAINCVGLSKELLESELFGHERGAFTGAHQLKKGKMELAHGGTVFLDEVGDISPDLQTKLLRFLQEREFERVGGTKPIRVDIRIIAATNRDLDGAVREGRFREDLYHRLNARELANVIERAIVLGQGPKITPSDLPPRISSAQSITTQPDSLAYREAVDASKRELIRRALSRTQGNRAAAAKLLGLQRTYLSRLIKSLQIE